MGLFKKTAAKGSFDLACDEDFIEVLYRVILDRKSDPDGKQHYLNMLAGGQADRREIVRGFVLSEEYQQNNLYKYPAHQVLFDYQEVASPAAFAPYVEEPPYTEHQLCELVNPRRWLEKQWFDFLLDMRVIQPGLQQMHRKGFEWVQTVFGLHKLGLLNDDSRALGVGSGHEALVYYLANHLGEVVATDLYEGAWTSEGGREGDPSVLQDPERYAPFEYRKDHLKFMRMNGCELEFEDNSFDVAFSISSIEHFGGHDNSAKSMAEMGRVIRPGGVIAVATEMVINGKKDREFFRPEDLLEYVVAPTGCKLVQMPEFILPAHAVANPSKLPEEMMHTPHLVLTARSVVFTSVVLFLRKPTQI